MAKAQPTSHAGLRKIETMFTAIEIPLARLYGRWLDEKEYEDIKDYGVVVQRSLPAGFRLVEMTKKPFGFTFQVEGEPGRNYAVTMTPHRYAWKRLDDTPLH